MQENNMARPFRIQFDGAFYHVMNRGRNRAPIFHSNNDYENFIKGLIEAHDQFSAKFHAFCLMPNHYHLFLETPKGNIARIMRHINGVYTQRHHRIYGGDGTIFKGRYKALLVDSEQYALDLIAYIHNNPISCKIPLVENLAEYPWSSFTTYLKKNKNYRWITTDFIDQIYLQKTGHANHAEYIKHEFSNIFTRLYSERKTHYIIGKNEFKKNILVEHFKNNVSCAKKIYGTPSGGQIIKAVAKIYNKDEATLVTPSFGRAKINMPRKIAIFMCQHLTNCSRKKIKDHFNLTSERAIDKAIYRVKQTLSQQKIDQLSIQILCEY